jgi:hypothetical protein
MASPTNAGTRLHTLDEVLTGDATCTILAFNKAGPPDLGMVMDAGRNAFIRETQIAALPLCSVCLNVNLYRRLLM